MKKLFIVSLFIAALLSACNTATPAPTATPEPAPTATTAPTLAPTEIPTEIPAATATATITPAVELKSGNFSKKVALTIQNNSGLNLSLYWINWDGKAELYGDIPTGTSLDQQTYPSHVWVLGDKDGNIVYVYIPTEDAKQKLVISKEGVKLIQALGLTDLPIIRSITSGPEVTLTFANTTDSPLNVYWVDENGVEQMYGTADAGGSYNVNTYFTHAWRVRDQSGHIILHYIATEDTTQTVTISPDWVSEALNQ